MFLIIKTVLYRLWFLILLDSEFLNLQLASERVSYEVMSYHLEVGINEYGEVAEQFLLCCQE